MPQRTGREPVRSSLARSTQASVSRWCRDACCCSSSQVLPKCMLAPEGLEPLSYALRPYPPPRATTRGASFEPPRRHKSVASPQRACGSLWKVAAARVLRSLLQVGRAATH